MSQFEDPSAQASVDPYSDAYTQPVAPPRDQEPNPRRSRSHSRERPASYNRTSTPPKRPVHAPIVSYRDTSISGLFIDLIFQAPNPCNVLGIFGLSIRTTERDLDDEFSRYGRVEKVVIVYDQRVSLTDPLPYSHQLKLHPSSQLVPVASVLLRCPPSRRLPVASRN